MKLWILLSGTLVFASVSLGAWHVLLHLWPDAGLQRLAVSLLGVPACRRAGASECPRACCKPWAG